MRLLHYTDDPSVQDPNTDEVVVEAMFEDADGDYCWFRHRVRAVRPGSQVGVSRIEYAVLRHSDDPTHHAATADMVATQTRGGAANHTCACWACPHGQFKFFAEDRGVALAQPLENWNNLMEAAFRTANAFAAMTTQLL
jgi:hypothetical protein